MAIRTGLLAVCMLLLGLVAGAATKWSTLVMVHRYYGGQAKTYRIEEPTCLLTTNETFCGGFYSEAKTIRIGQVREIVIERGSIIVVVEH